MTRPYTRHAALLGIPSGSPEYQKAWNALNPERRKKHQHSYHEAHLEKRKAVARERHRLERGAVQFLKSDPALWERFLAWKDRDG